MPRGRKTRGGTIVPDDPINMINDNPDPLEQEMQKAEEAMAEVDAINNQTKILGQESENKTHDTELTQDSVDLGMITDEDVSEAYQTLLKYKEKKADLEKKIQDNEEFWKLNHWNVVQQGKEDDGRIKPKSAWLVNTIMNKHADAMDNYPEPNILPRERSDEETAKVLSDVIPVILDQQNYEKTYSDAEWYREKHGTNCQGVFWNNDLNNGLGDVDIKKIDILDMYWQPGISDIQDSPNVFHVSYMNREEAEARYPDLKVGSSTLPVANGSMDAYGTETRNEDQIEVVDWYYKRRVHEVDENGIPKYRTVLHYCKFACGQVLYASENKTEYADRGFYDHGLYPFVFSTLFPVEKSITGMGWIDIIKDDQLYIDKLQQAILENAIVNARPRWAVNNQAGLNKEQFLDISNPLVEFEGRLGEDDFRQIHAAPLSGIYETVYQSKIQEMKDTSGNTAASQGQISQVTAASGIASLQEAAGKLSRDSNASAYRAYKQVVNLVIELIRQFYTEERCFRISGDDGSYSYVSLDNSGLVPQPQGMAGGIDLGNRLPIMDIDVRPQKRSMFTKEAQNQTALNLYAQGFFAPQNADSALACLEMMEFEGVEKVRDRITQNGTLYDQLMQMQNMLMQLGAVVDAQNGTNITGMMPPEGNQPTGAAVKTSKGSLSSQAATATRESTAPR